MAPAQSPRPRVEALATAGIELPKHIIVPLKVACRVASLPNLHGLDKTRANMSNLRKGSSKLSG